MKKGLFGGFPGGRFIGKEELNEVAKIIKSRSPYRFYGLDLQRRTERLESICCHLFGRKYALAVSSGTAALHTALFSIDVSKGDEVIIPAYAWSSNLMSVLALGAVPVIAPIDETLGLDASLLEDNITKKTKAIMAVHMRGLPCNLKEIMKIGRAHRIKVIEDGSQCMGGRICKGPVGKMGDISVFSFQYNKLVTSGEGGILLTDEKGLYEKARCFHDLGMLRSAGKADPEGLRTIGSFGLNYRLSELQAAFLIAQFEKMDRILKGLKRSYGFAVDAISPITQRFNLTARKIPFDSQPNHAFLCLSAATAKDADRAQKALRKNGLPAQRSSRLGGHHFKVWRRYMLRRRQPFRFADNKISARFLKRSIYIEINAGKEGN